MRATVLLGVALGFGAILVAWCTRAPRGVAGAPGGVGAPAGVSAHGDAAGARPADARDLEALRDRQLTVPVAGFDLRKLRDSFAEPRSGHSHEAIDLMAPRGTAVVAADDGTIARLLTSARGGLTIYQIDPTARYGYYYAHLDGYALGLREGRTVRRGETLGYVGSTGNASRAAPHLHFAVSRLGPEGRWGEGVALNPYVVFLRADRAGSVR